MKQQIGLFLGAATFAMVLLLPMANIGPEAQRMLAVVALMAIWWITEALPLAATALLPLLLFPLLGISSASATSVNYANENVFLFIGGFLLAFGLERWGLHRRLALAILSLIKGQPARLLLALMMVTWFLSMWVSNTATALIMLPIGLAVLGRMGSETSSPAAKPFDQAILLGIAYAASIGGLATLVGTPPNIILKGYMNTAFPGEPVLSFARWMAFMLPFSLALMVGLWLLLMRTLPFPKDSKVDTGYVRQELASLGPLSFAERSMLTIFSLTALLWIARADIDLGAFTIPGWAGLTPWPELFHDSTVAIGMALLCFLFPVDWKQGKTLLSWEQAKKLPWNIILLFGGGFALAYGITASGLDAFIAAQMGMVQVLPLVFVIAGIVVVMSLLSELASNTAAASVMLPVIGPLAVPLGVDPLVLLLPATLGASIGFMLPVATPPNTIVFGSGYIRIGTMVRVGFWLDLIAIAMTVGFVMLIKNML